MDPARLAQLIKEDLEADDSLVHDSTVIGDGTELSAAVAVKRRKVATAGGPARMEPGSKPAGDQPVVSDASVGQVDAEPPPPPSRRPMPKRPGRKRVTADLPHGEPAPAPASVPVSAPPPIPAPAPKHTPASRAVLDAFLIADSSSASSSGDDLMEDAPEREEPASEPTKTAPHAAVHVSEATSISRGVTVERTGATAVSVVVETSANVVRVSEAVVPGPAQAASRRQSTPQGTGLPAQGSPPADTLPAPVARQAGVPPAETAASVARPAAVARSVKSPGQSTGHVERPEASQGTARPPGAKPAGGFAQDTHQAEGPRGSGLGEQHASETASSVARPPRSAPSAAVTGQGVDRPRGSQPQAVTPRGVAEVAKSMARPPGTKPAEAFGQGRSQVERPRESGVPEVMTRPPGTKPAEAFGQHTGQVEHPRESGAPEVAQRMARPPAAKPAESFEQRTSQVQRPRGPAETASSMPRPPTSAAVVGQSAGGPQGSVLGGPQAPPPGGAPGMAESVARPVGRPRDTAAGGGAVMGQSAGGPQGSVLGGPQASPPGGAPGMAESVARPVGRPRDTAAGGQGEGSPAPQPPPSATAGADGGGAGGGPLPGPDERSSLVHRIRHAAAQVVAGAAPAPPTLRQHWQESVRTVSADVDYFMGLGDEPASTRRPRTPPPAQPPAGRAEPTAVAFLEAAKAGLQQQPDEVKFVEKVASFCERNFEAWENPATRAIVLDKAKYEFGDGVKFSDVAPVETGLKTGRTLFKGETLRLVDGSRAFAYPSAREKLLPDAASSPVLKQEVRRSRPSNVTTAEFVVGLSLYSQGTGSETNAFEVRSTDSLTSVLAHIPCPLRRHAPTISGRNPVSGFLFAGTTFYARTTTETIDYVTPIKSGNPVWEDCNEVSMDSATWGDLQVALNQDCIFRHHGRCDHVVRVRYLRQDDPSELLPCRTRIAIQPQAPICQVCGHREAAKLLHASPELPSDAFICLYCDAQLHGSLADALPYISLAHDAPA